MYSTNIALKCFRQNVRKSLFFLLIVFAVIVYLFNDYNCCVEFRLKLRFELNSLKRFTNYSINTPTCKIPYIEPWAEEVLPFFEKLNYKSCSEYPPLSFIDKTKGSITLNINQTLLSTYSWLWISCCYSTVNRLDLKDEPENQVSYSSCIFFEDSVVIDAGTVMVTCKNSFFHTVYQNVHAIISPGEFKPNNSSDVPSVLLIGIDSISNSSLIRSLPETHSFLTNNNFMSLNGYTKIGLNTFPNLVGLLTGMRTEQLSKTCSYWRNIDDCYFIWKDFKAKGYVTAYAEDGCEMSTFNYKKMGFRYSPTDFYFRQYMLAAENIPNPTKSCSGPEQSGERILNLIKDFQSSLREYPKFGLFWMNTFSHDELNSPTAMDGKVMELLSDIYPHLDNTILFFFSDHGFRFGQFRQTAMGWFEERTPFFYIHLPDKFKDKFPQKHSNLLHNRNQLTTPFDVYLTLQDILGMESQSKACPSCKSLFQKLGDRSCPEAGIDTNWCVCNLKSDVSTELPIVQLASSYLMEYINNLVEEHEDGVKCAYYKLKNVEFSAKSDGERDIELWLEISTVPKANFESYLRVGEDGRMFQVLGDIERLDWYAPHSRCVENATLKRFCFCEDS